MKHFWQIISEIHFKRLSEADLKILGFIQKKCLEDSPEASEGVDVPVFASRSSIELSLDLISPEYEFLYGGKNLEINKKNLFNLLKSYYLSLSWYQPLLQKSSVKVKKCSRFSF